MAEARLHRDEIVRDGHQRKRPRKQDRSGYASFQAESEAKKARQIEKEVVCLAHGFEQDALLGRLGDTDPKEVDALQAVLNKPQFV